MPSRVRIVTTIAPKLEAAFSAWLTSYFSVDTVLYHDEFNKVSFYIEQPLENVVKQLKQLAMRFGVTLIVTYAEITPESAGDNANGDWKGTQGHTKKKHLGRPKKQGRSEAKGKQRVVYNRLHGRELVSGD